MSTRATYEIDGHTFYIHHDGYPDGAAMYFSRALAHRDARMTGEVDGAPNATLADDFMRGNARAELTDSHETHCDTEYCYVTRTAEDYRFGEPVFPFSAMKRTQSGWRVIYRGTLSDFIEQHDALIAT